jgi:hypothetical protein
LPIFKGMAPEGSFLKRIFATTGKVFAYGKS